MRILRIDDNSPYCQAVGIGGLGTGMFFALEGNHTLGRNESRAARLLDVRDYCKLHIVMHYIAKLLGAGAGANFRILPIGAVGDDAAGEFVRQELARAGIDTRFVEKIRGMPTLFSACFQYPDGSGGNITTNNSAASAFRCPDLAIGNVLASAGTRGIALILPEVPLEVRRRFLEEASRRKALRVASFVSAEIARARKMGMFDELDLIAVNEGEASELIGTTFSPERPESFLDQCAQFLRKRYPSLRMVISAGKHGAYAVSQDFWNCCQAPGVQMASTTGAGDCLLGGIVAALAAGVPLLNSKPPRKSLVERSLDTALEFGVLLASYKLTSPHTIHPQASVSSLLRFAQQLGAQFAPPVQQLFVDAHAPRENPRASV
jgi:sugar/nucleoside kinase (ribokinase family)